MNDQVQQNPTILITGGTGLIGSAIIPSFIQQSFKIIVLTRSSQKITEKYAHQNVHAVSSFDEIAVDEHIDYVINLAGESIGGPRWTDARKEKLISSRVSTTEHLVNWLLKTKQQPKCIISGSAVGYYGIDPSLQWHTVCNENSPPQPIFLSEICQRWEQSIAPLKNENLNVKIIRLGVVFAKQSPALKQMLLPIKMNLVGNVGSGQQPLTWIHIDDVVAAIHFLLKDENQGGVYNLCAPDHETQADFVKVSQRVLGKTTFFPMPAAFFKVALGEQANLIINGQFVAPKNLLAAGYQFKHPNLESALEDLL